MKLLVSGFDPAKTAHRETLFHTANGYVGVRSCLECGVPEGIKSIRGTYLNAFYDLKPMVYTESLYGFPKEQESMVNVVDVQTIRLHTPGGEVSPFTAPPLSYTQTLDMAEGVSRRVMRLCTPEGGQLDLRIERLASFVQPEFFCLRYAVTSVDYEGTLVFTSVQDGEVSSYADPDDPRVSQSAHRHLRVEEIRRAGDDFLMTCRTERSGLRMASAVGHVLEGDCHERTAEQHQERVTERFACAISPGGQVVLQKYCIFADSRRQEDPGTYALALLQSAREISWDRWKQRQRVYLDAFWGRARVEIDAPGEEQTEMDFALYQLLQSAGRDALSNVAAKGLSGEGYEGHYFWDTEIYLFPFFLMTDRERALQLLRYRHGILDAARRHARDLGHTRGALYPWRTIAGRECSGYFPSGSAQYHINGDVAHAFGQYWHLTHDLDAMEEMGAEVLLETARLWLDVGHERDGQFHIDGVTGPDEYTCMVDDNYYTNVSAQSNLRDAVEVWKALEQAGRAEALWERLRVTEEELWHLWRTADRMYLPYDEKLGILAQDESFLGKKRLDLSALPPQAFPLLLSFHPLFLYRHQVLKQADAVLALYLYEEDITKEVMARTYDYYEPLTTHDSSLSPCVHGIVAARLKRLPQALSYFRKTARMDLDDTHQNTGDGLHTANLGGMYLGVVMGFAGLRIGRSGVSLRPQLPPDWRGYRFSFAVGDSRVLLVCGGDGIALSLASGASVDLLVDGKPVHVGKRGWTRPWKGKNGSQSSPVQRE